MERREVRLSKSNAPAELFGGQSIATMNPVVCSSRLPTCAARIQRASMSFSARPYAPVRRRESRNDVEGPFLLGRPAQTFYRS